MSWQRLTFNRRRVLERVRDRKPIDKQGASMTRAKHELARSKHITYNIRTTPCTWELSDKGRELLRP